MIYFFSSHLEGGWVILFHIFCNPMHVLFHIILLSYVVFMYVFTSVFKYCKIFLNERPLEGRGTGG